MENFPKKINYISKDYTRCLRIPTPKPKILTPRLNLVNFLDFIFKDFIYLFLDRGEGWEKKRERNINVWLPLACPLLGAWLAAQACA